MIKEDIRVVVEAVQAALGPLASCRYPSDDGDQVVLEMQSVPATVSVVAIEGERASRCYDVQVESRPPGRYLYTDEVSLDRLMDLLRLMRGPQETWPGMHGGASAERERAAAPASPRDPALPPAGRALPPVPPHALWLRPVMGAVAMVRIALATSVMLIGLLVILVLAPLPVRVAGVALAAWPLPVMARLLLFFLGLRITAHRPERIREHRGVVVANHLSFLDIPLLLRTVPLRFLSTIGVKTYPVVGWIARAVGTLFVDRTSAISRGRAMQQMERALAAEPYPALAVFAEGGIGPGDRVQAFRTGAFRLAADTGLGVLPVALRYSRPEVALWKEEPPARVLWRVATRLRPIRATIIPLEVAAQPGDVEAWAEAAQEAVAEAVRLPATPFDPDAAR